MEKPVPHKIDITHQKKKEKIPTIPIYKRKLTGRPSCAAVTFNVT